MASTSKMRWEFSNSNTDGVQRFELRLRFMGPLIAHTEVDTAPDACADTTAFRHYTRGQRVSQSRPTAPHTGFCTSRRAPDARDHGQLPTAWHTHADALHAGAWHAAQVFWAQSLSQ